MSCEKEKRRQGNGRESCKGKKRGSVQKMGSKMTRAGYCDHLSLQSIPGE